MTKNKIEKEVMLAPNQAIELKDLKYPLYGSYKMDGIRCLIKNGMILGRSGKPLPNKNLQKRFKGLLDYKQYVYDGELHCKSMTFNEIQSIIMSKEAPLKGIKLYIFDMMTLSEWNKNDKSSYSFRLGLINAEVRIQNDKNIVGVKQKIITCEQEAKDLYDEAIAKGYEGIMLRHMLGKYKHGRCTIKEANIFKVKAWQEYDGVIISVNEGKRLKKNASKTTNELGRTKRSHKQEDYEPSKSFGFFVVEVKDDNNKTISTVEIGSWKGITKKLRDEIWKNKKDYIGCWVRFKGMAVGVKDKPRMPKEMQFRDPK